MKLSILIPTLPKRNEMLHAIENELLKQAMECQAMGQCEIITNHSTQKTTGFKRNFLVTQASGEYIVHFDDDDWPEPCYISEILKGIETGADCMAINGTMTTNGKDSKRWYISIHNPYTSSKDAGGNEIYLRYPNHITPMKRSLAMLIPFPDKTIGEDFEFATAIKAAGLLKTEHTIIPPIYHYRFITNK